VALVPFIAQNFGAEEPRRVDDAIAFAGKTSFYWGAALFVALVIFAGPTARLFSADPEIIRNMKLYFYIVAVSYAPYGIVLVTGAIFNGVQVPGQSLRVLIVRTLALTFPLVAIGSMFGAAGIFGGLSLSNFAGAAYAARRMKRSLIESGSEMATRRPIDDYIAD
jgi:Na+-driven multidrug efflux pump